MVSRKKFSEEEIKNIGFRIKSCRVLTGLNQEEFANKYHFPTPSIKNWEFGSVIPRTEGLKKFIEAISLNGIFVSPDWVLYAHGAGPIYSLKTVSNSNMENTTSDDFSFFKDWFEKCCKKSKNNPIIFIVSDDEMSPLFNVGDLIAGTLIDYNSFKNLINPQIPLIIKSDDGNYKVRYIHSLDESLFYCSIKNPQIKKIGLNMLGNILWHKHTLNLSIKHNE